MVHLPPATCAVDGTTVRAAYGPVGPNVNDEVVSAGGTTLATEDIQTGRCSKMYRLSGMLVVMAGCSPNTSTKGQLIR
jgi:hypothetical protein